MTESRQKQINRDCRRSNIVLPIAFVLIIITILYLINGNFKNQFYMKTIHKYPIKTIDEQQVSMPVGAQILCVQEQNDVLTLWARVDDSENKEARHICVYGTGHEVNEYDLAYIGTVQDFSGLVWHVFENK